MTVDERYARDLSEADGWIIIHHRAMSSSSCYFGPFTSIADAQTWNRSHPSVAGVILPVYKTVRWDRVI